MQKKNKQKNLKTRLTFVDVLMPNGGTQKKNKKGISMCNHNRIENVHIDDTSSGYENCEYKLGGFCKLNEELTTLGRKSYIGRIRNKINILPEEHKPKTRYQ